MTVPIISSLLDLDFYKLTMLQLIWRRHRDVPVTFEFRNRTTSVPLAEFVRLDDLTRELGHVSDLRCTDEEIAYLATLGVFDPAFLAWLREPGRIPLTVGTVGATRDGQLRIKVSGPWSQVTLWETIVLSIVNELYYREVVRRSGQELEHIELEGSNRLTAKIEALRHCPDIRIVEFGTRRRFSRDWHELTFANLLCLGEVRPPQLLGTSNVFLAKLYHHAGVRPIGTLSHELDMAYSGIYRDMLRWSHRLVLDHWWNEYGEPLSIALTDTYTSDFFFEDMTGSQARKWRGLRQDSGDPIAFAEKAIAFYERHGVDPKTKTIVFSDGLDVEAIVRIANHCRGRIQYAFGWGTNLTNDVGFDPLSLVMKVTNAAGHGTVKLSDNLAKAQGSPEDIALFVRAFGHAPTTREECTY